MKVESKENRSLNIWVVGRNYPTENNRMCGSFELAQAKMLAKHGHNVTYVSLVFHPLYKANNWGSWRSYEDGVRIATLSYFWAPQRLHLYMDFVKEKSWRNFLPVLEAETGLPDVIHMHFPSLLPCPGPLLEYAERGTEVVATEHWTKVQRRALDSHETRQLTDCVERADAFICVGSELKDSVVAITGTSKQIITLPNIASREFYPATNSHDGFRFVAVGRLVKIKQFDRIIKTFCETFSYSDDVFLEIVGGGPEKTSLTALVKSLGASNRVKLTGELGKAETGARLRDADCLICYSGYETFGVPVIEAWASGLPTIASDAIGFKEYWRPELGLLISKDDDAALGRAMVEIREGTKDYDPSFITSYANEHFSEDAIYRSLMQIYESHRRTTNAH